MGQADPGPGSPPGMLRRPGRGDRQATAMREVAVQVASQQANRAADHERELRQHQQARDGWLEAHAHLGPTYRRVVRELAWQHRARGLAVEQEPPGWMRAELGPVPESTRGRRAWRQAAAAITDYRSSYQVSDPERALGPAPRNPAQRAAYREVQRSIGRVHTKHRQHGAREQQLTRSQSASAARGQPDPTTRQGRERPGRAGPERAAG
jgi:hypothetical protein